MHPIADAAATLGSRFNLIFSPHDFAVYHNAYGEFKERPLKLTAAIRTPDGSVWALPFTARERHFPYLEQFSALTYVEYRGMQPSLGIEFSMKVRSPFYPRDVQLSTAPFFYVDLTVRRLARFLRETPQTPVEQGELVFGIEGEGLEFEALENGFAYSFPSTSAVRTVVADHPYAGRSKTAQARGVITALQGNACGQNGVEGTFSLLDASTFTMRLLWSGWASDPFMEAFGQDCPFKYREFYKSEEDMVDWAVENRTDIEGRCDFLDGLFANWSLGSSASELASLAFHSFLLNTWWVTRPKGGDWFSVWEGSCHYHSTIDVEYNGAFVYLALWPELLGMLLDEWAEFEVDGSEALGQKGEGTSFVCHDMGSCFAVGQQCYAHHMPIEETTNYLLLLAAWCSFTGDTKKARAKLALCRRLGEFLVRSDTTGNGFPNLGTANTIDDASPALQFGGSQVYLAVKMQAALWALAELEEVCDPQNSSAERWRAFTAKSIKTLDAEGWLEDHYAVSIARTTDGITDPRSGEPLPEGELQGWDDYSIYSSNGLLYLFVGSIRMPRWRLVRFADDVENAERRTRTPYGSSHTAASDRTVWFSQNIWRDCVAAYLGVDMLNNVERYWDYQTLTGDNLQSSLYNDATWQNNLSFYPRGAAIFGMPFSAAGLRLNRVKGEIHLRSIRRSLDVPLFPLADWSEMRVPVFTVRSREGVATARISEADLLEGLSVKVQDAELETA